MRYWSGLVLFAAGIYLLYAGLAQRRRVLSARRQGVTSQVGEESAPLHPSLAMLGDIFRPLIVIGLSIIGVKFTMMYVVLDAGRVFSPFDLAGLLFLMAAYGVWLIFKTKYPEVGRTSAPIAPPAIAASAQPPQSVPTAARPEPVSPVSEVAELSPRRAAR